MDSIERSIQASWQHRMIFSEAIFDPVNTVLRDTLATNRRGKAIVVVDESLVACCPSLPGPISRYFALHDPPLDLVCPPLIREGGEGAKSSWGNVAEIHRAIDMYHLDRHSYVIAVGGGALLDQVGLPAPPAPR